MDVVVQLADQAAIAWNIIGSPAPAHADVAHFAIKHRQRRGCVFDEKRQQFLVVAKGRLHLLTLGDVGESADPLAHTAVFFSDWDCAGRKPAVLSVGATQPELLFIAVPFFKESRPGLYDSAALVRVDSLGPFLARFFRRLSG